MDGIIIINKPKEYTSHDVVAKVKKIMHEKVGHTGTLDPMATGVLPLLIGQGTKISYYITNHDKIYEVVLKLGAKTDTLDTEGTIIEEKQVPKESLEKENIEKVFKELLGKQKQIPPMHSAIKVNGKKLYEYARANKKVEIPEREIEIYNISLNEISVKEKTISFQVHCSKGTYIRTLCETIAERLNTIGYMQNLNRIAVGNFTLNEAVTLEELEKNKENANFLNKHFITLEKFFEKSPCIFLSSEKLTLFENGVCLSRIEDDGIYQIRTKEKWVGIGIIENHLLKRKIIVDAKTLQ